MFSEASSMCDENSCALPSYRRAGLWRVPLGPGKSNRKSEKSVEAVEVVCGSAAAWKDLGKLRSGIGCKPDKDGGCRWGTATG